MIPLLSSELTAVFVNFTLLIEWYTKLPVESGSAKPQPPYALASYHVYGSASASILASQSNPSTSHLNTPEKIGPA